MLMAVRTIPSRVTILFTGACSTGAGGGDAITGAVVSTGFSTGAAVVVGGGVVGAGVGVGFGLAGTIFSGGGVETTSIRGGGVEVTVGTDVTGRAIISAATKAKAPAGVSISIQLLTLRVSLTGTPFSSRSTTLKCSPGAARTLSRVALMALVSGSTNSALTHTGVLVGMTILNHFPGSSFRGDFKLISSSSVTGSPLRRRVITSPARPDWPRTLTWSCLTKAFSGGSIGTRPSAFAAVSLGASAVIAGLASFFLVGAAVAFFGVLERLALETVSVFFAGAESEAAGALVAVKSVCASAARQIVIPMANATQRFIFITRQVEI